MHTPQIKIVNNPFNVEDPAWEDELGRVGVRVKNENTVHWYDIVIEESSGKHVGLMDEVTMIIDEPFNEKDATCHYSIN